MNCDAFIAELDDWLDDELPPEQAAGMREHVAGCAGCEQRLAAAHRLQERVFALPRSQEPPRDLWPDIERRIASRGVRETPWLRGLAAGVLLAAVFFSGMLADQVLDEKPPAAPQRLVEDTREEAGRLPSAAEARRLLPASHVALVDGAGTGGDGASGTGSELLQNLLLVNLAIREVEDAAAANPSNADLRELLAGLYVQENRILSQAERLQVSRQANSRTGI